MMEEVDLADTPLAMRPQLQSQSSVSASDEEPPDPRIQIELERLNTSTDLINKLEVDLDEARMMFRQTLLESTQQIDNLTKKLGKCIDQARPYYDARIKAKQALTEAQKSAVRYERAVSQHAAAREMVQLAEEGLLTRGCIFDSTWQEMLNHATTKVNDAEREKTESTTDHNEKTNKYHESDQRVKFLQKELKRSIAKSSLNARRSLLQMSNIIRMQELQLLPYFELKASVNQRLEEQKRHVRELETAVAGAKTNYSQALTNLETISNQIHKTRQSCIDLGIRGVGVGAESPGPPFSTSGEQQIAKEKSAAAENGTFSDDLREKEFDQKSSQPLIQTSGTSNNTSCTTTSSTSITPRVASTTSTSRETGSTTVDEHAKTSVLATCDPESTQIGAGNGEDPPTLGSDSTPAPENGDSQGSYLSGWQFVAMSSLPPSRNQSLLSIEDRESVVSDSESLTSMEMLSEEAIANLMLEEEINEATHSICVPPLPEEYMAPPKTLAPLPLHGGVARKGGKSSSQTSSSDSGEPWEIVADSGQEDRPVPSSNLPCNTPSSNSTSSSSTTSNTLSSNSTSSNTPSSASSIPTTSNTLSSNPTTSNTLSSNSTSSNGPAPSSNTPSSNSTFNTPSSNKRERAPKCPEEVKEQALSKPRFLVGGSEIVVSSNANDSCKMAPKLTCSGSPQKSAISSANDTGSAISSDIGIRPQSLGVRAAFSKSSSGSCSSSSSTNSLSEGFSPSYAPLGETPEVESRVVGGENANGGR